MNQTPAEEQLVGGNSNAPTRIGDRVHRDAGLWTPTVHALLQHVRARGADWLPEPFGLDSRGREVLDYLPGEVPGYPMPDYVWSESTLTDAAAALRSLHHATLDFSLDDRIWQQPTHTPAEVVCHNDFAPYNFVFTDGRLSGVIDIDMASPGPRVRDLCYLAYRLVPLSQPGNGGGAGPQLTFEHRAARLQALCTAYGEISPKKVIEATPSRLRELADFSDGRAHIVPELNTHALCYRIDADWVEVNAEQLVPPQESALLIMLPSADPAITSQRARFDRSASAGVPAHLTVIYPFRSAATMTDDDHQRLSEVIRTHRSFVVKLTATGWFGDNVVFLAPEDPDPLIKLIRSLEAAFPDFRPYAGAFDELVPHATIGHDASLVELQRAESEVHGHLPLNQSVEEVQLWTGPALTTGLAGWRCLRSYPLSSARY